jgi:hypothetical protein
VGDLSPRPSRRLTRKQREERAYALTLATGGGAVLTVVSAVLAVLGVTGFGLALVLALVTVGLGYALKRTLNA